MGRSDYYEKLKAVARKIRADYGLATPRVQRSDLRRIFSKEGVRIDLWPPSLGGKRASLKSLRGAYFNDSTGPTVLLSRHLPAEPAIFTMGHELKHHLVDRSLPLSFCDQSNRDDAIEIGAEIFAAELIFPDGDFQAWFQYAGIDSKNCTAETIVRLKRETQTTLSYASLAKRAEFFQFVSKGSLASIRWKLLEEKIYGIPIYKRILRRRALLT